MPRGRDQKRAKVATPPTVTKTVPGWALAPVYEGRRLSWSFSATDSGGRWSWTQFPEDRLGELLRKLAAFETMDYQSLKNYRSVYEPGRLVKEARERLVEIRRDDVDRLTSFHLDGPGLVWCCDHDSIMFVLWWDAEHSVYPTPKRNT